MRALLEREVTHLVLLDLMMPGEDGLSLTRYIRQRSEIPIIILTGKGDLIDRVVGLETGANDYVPKPFELREVLARIRSVIGQVRSPHLPRLCMPRPPVGMPARFSSSKAGGSTCSGASCDGRVATSCSSPPESSSCYAPSPAIPTAC
jgi:DNA-binding response OmpR family regulator